MSTEERLRQLLEQVRRTGKTTANIVTGHDEVDIIATDEDNLEETVGSLVLPEGRVRHGIQEGLHDQSYRNDPEAKAHVEAEALSLLVRSLPKGRHFLEEAQSDWHHSESLGVWVYTLQNVSVSNG